MERPSDSHHPLCPLEFVLELVSARWTTLLLTDLKRGPKRPSELVRSFPRISAKTLTQRLRELEESGFIRREAFDEIPPRVVYSLTDTGNDLMCVLEALTELGHKWQKQQLRSQEDEQKKCKNCATIQALEEPTSSAPILKQEEIDPLDDSIQIAPRIAAVNAAADRAAELAEPARAVETEVVNEPQQQILIESFFTLRPGDPRRLIYEKKMLEAARTSDRQTQK